MATLALWLTVAVGRADAILVRRARRPVSRTSTDPLAPSSAHDARARGSVPEDESTPAVRCASLSTCCPAFRSPQSLPDPHSTVKGGNQGLPRLHSGRANNTTWLTRRLCPPRSLEEPAKITTRTSLCQVDQTSSGATLPLSLVLKSSDKRAILPGIWHYVK